MNFNWVEKFYFHPKVALFEKKLKIYICHQTEKCFVEKIWLFNWKMFGCSCKYNFA